jgi:hypothetical protein
VRASRALSIDSACVVVFVIIGRRNHGEGSAAAGILRTAAPFLIALGLAWLGARKQSAHAATWRFGVPIWLSTVVFGLLFRRFLFGNGTALPFVIVATLFLGLALMGWRLVRSLVPGRRTTV